jgi:lysophospholipase L1-like esterase
MTSRTLPAPLAEAVRSASWRMLGRIALKTALLFLLLNGLFAWAYPLEALGRMSLYNHLWPGRLRLPYGEDPALSYNLSLNNVPAMLHSHAVVRAKADDEYRVLVIGDSATWGWFLHNRDTLSGRLNAGGYTTTAGQRLVFYNLGYPVMSLTKDLMLLDAAMDYEPDLILWPVTLESFARARQLDHPLLQHNPQRVRRLIARFDLDLDPQDPRFVEPSGWQRTLVGQRRALADLMRLQSLGLAWAATGVDQYIPAEIPRRKTDLDPDLSWKDLKEPTTLDAEVLAFDVLAAGMARAGAIPVLLVNEPMFISQGENSDLRYNSFYPRWAYDQYRQLLAREAREKGWSYLDLWDAIPPEEFTDTPVHLTPAGSQMLADILGPEVVRLADQAGTAPD